MSELEPVAPQLGTRQWLKVFFRQWLWEMIRWPGDWREHFQGTCFRCMHYKSQHIRHENGLVKCAGGDGCGCTFHVKETL